MIEYTLSQNHTSNCQSKRYDIDPMHTNSHSRQLCPRRHYTQGVTMKRIRIPKAQRHPLKHLLRVRATTSTIHSMNQPRVVTILSMKRPRINQPRVVTILSMNQPRVVTILSMNQPRVVTILSIKRPRVVTAITTHLMRYVKIYRCALFV